MKALKLLPEDPWDGVTTVEIKDNWLDFMPCFIITGYLADNIRGRFPMIIY